MNCGRVSGISDEKLDPVTEIEFTPEFKRNLRVLSKKYRSIRADVQPVIDQIQKGAFPGDQISRTGIFTFFKVRVKNTDIHKGKSSGYRLIYYVKSDKKVVLITIYSKTEQSDISPDQIWRILRNYENKDQNQ